MRITIIGSAKGLPLPLHAKEPGRKVVHLDVEGVPIIKILSVPNLNGNHVYVKVGVEVETCGVPITISRKMRRILFVLERNLMRKISAIVRSLFHLRRFSPAMTEPDSELFTASRSYS
uniref:(northern house mosquito) hypothetical protein n=1 Tax=Culex pipiens TaxID=7175 RepID=A0A8D8B2W1_CULPI